MNGEVILAELAVVAAAAVMTWLASSARRLRVRLIFRFFLLAAGIASTTLLAASVALFFLLSRGSADSPAAAVPLIVAFLCAGIAVPAWIGFFIQARRGAGAPDPV